jgi:hypothetical protein
MVSIPQTIVFSTEKIFLTAETIFLVNHKMFVGFATTVFVSQTKGFAVHTNSGNGKARSQTRRQCSQA